MLQEHLSDTRQQDHHDRDDHPHQRNRDLDHQELHKKTSPLAATLTPKTLVGLGIDLLEKGSAPYPRSDHDDSLRDQHDLPADENRRVAVPVSVPSSDVTEIRSGNLQYSEDDRYNKALPLSALYPFVSHSIKAEPQDDDQLFPTHEPVVSAEDVTDRKLSMRTSDRDEAKTSVTDRGGLPLFFDGNNNTAAKAAVAVAVDNSEDAAQVVAGTLYDRHQVLSSVEDGQFRLVDRSNLDDTSERSTVFHTHGDEGLLNQRWNSSNGETSYGVQTLHRHHTGLENNESVTASSGLGYGTNPGSVTDAGLPPSGRSHDHNGCHDGAFESDFSMLPWSSGPGPSPAQGLLLPPLPYDGSLGSHQPHQEHEQQQPYQHYAQQQPHEYQPWLLSSRYGYGQANGVSDSASTGTGNNGSGLSDSHRDKRLRPSFAGMRVVQSFVDAPPNIVDPMSMSISSSSGGGVDARHTASSPHGYQNPQQQGQHSHSHYLHHHGNGQSDLNYHDYQQQQQQQQQQDHYPGQRPRRRRHRHHRESAHYHNSLAHLDIHSPTSNPTDQRFISLSGAAVITSISNNAGGDGYATDSLVYTSYPSGEYSSENGFASTSGFQSVQPYQPMQNSPYNHHASLPLSILSSQPMTSEGSVVDGAPSLPLPTKNGPYPRRNISKHTLQSMDPDPKYCNNCHTRSTPSWRRCPEGQILLCNACGLYQKLHGKSRPFFKAKDGTIKIHRTQTEHEPCAVCGTTSTPIWRKGPKNENLCNACHLVLKHSGSRLDHRRGPKRYDDDDDEDCNENGDSGNRDRLRLHDRHHPVPDDDCRDNHHKEGQQTFYQKRSHSQRQSRPIGSSSCSPSLSSGTPSPPAWSQDRGIVFGYEGDDVRSDFGMVDGVVANIDSSATDHHPMVKDGDTTESSPIKRFGTPEKSASRQVRTSAVEKVQQAEGGGATRNPRSRSSLSTKTK